MVNIFSKLQIPLFFRHPIISGVGAIISGIACSFISDYSISKVWESTHVDYLVVKLIAVLLACPWVYVLLGALLVILNCYASHESTKALEKENEDLNSDLSDKTIKLSNAEAELKNLNSQKNGYQENIQELNDQIYGLQNRLAVGWLKHVFKTKGFGTNERVSIYFELNNEFTLLARYSLNPTYNQIHRQKFPVNQGVISKAWAEGHWIEDRCPVHNLGNSNYKQYMAKKYCFNQRDIDKFAMKSCWYVAVAISKADDNVGVIVFESIVQNRITTTDVEELISYCKSEQSHLVQFIEESIALDNAKRMESANIARNTDQDILSLMNGGF
ncbi:hypothetical protein [Acinetobacter calcoaceticus]|uniref:hypothetical protein n=1 Tax=Acinetobacter calcoaceticus TaxID=471 RepID=UPI001E2C807E|nr:hypothetical protein [Acinetobacter calcoaceticus]UGQ26830.1 hypothetical protein LRO55_02775 [Acinetobacter calcoaceticus]